MKKVHLLNAAVMPTAGDYQIEQINGKTFQDAVFSAFTNGTLHHYIGYQNTLDFVQAFCGIQFKDEQAKISVEQTELSHQDELLILRLRRRVSPEAKKVQTRDATFEVTEQDFDFYWGIYRDPVDHVQFQSEWDRILQMTGNHHDDLSLNLEEQRVIIRENTRRPKRVKRTIYRAHFDDAGVLLGYLHQPNNPDDRWSRYRFDVRMGYWRHISQFGDAEPAKRRTVYIS